VGSITESDILSSAFIYCGGIHVKPEPGARRAAERRKVEIRTYIVSFHELIEDIEAAVKGMLELKA